MKELTIEHLAKHLPYGLKMYCKDMYDDGNPELSIDEVFSISVGEHNGEIESIFDTWWNAGNDNYNLSDKSWKPILRPLNDLSKIREELEEKYYTLKIGYEVDSVISDHRWLNQCSYLLITELLERHFDVDNLIEKGLAIDVNTLEVNPYK